MKTSVIVCTRNRIHDLLCMLDSTAKQTVLPDEIIIVDSSTQPINQDDRFQSIWSQSVFSCKLIYKHTTPGLTYQRNQGVLLAAGDIIYFFDDDVVLSQTYIEEMNRAFHENPAYGGGMGTVSNIGSYKPRVNIPRALFFLQRNYASGKFTVSGMPTHAYGRNEFTTVEVLGGCCMAFRSFVFERYGFDEALHLYGYMEDCDFSYRVSRSWPLFYNPRAQLEHRESPLNRDSVIDNKAMFIANYTYLFFKNFYPKSKWKIGAYWWSIAGLFLKQL